MDGASGEPVGTKGDSRDGEKTDLWHLEQLLVFMWLWKAALEAGLPWSPTPHSTLRACLGGYALRAESLPKTPTKGDGMNWAQQDMALGKRPGLRASEKMPRAGSRQHCLPRVIPGGTRQLETSPPCPRQRTVGQPMVSRQDWRSLDSQWLCKSQQRS